MHRLESLFRLGVATGLAVLFASCTTRTTQPVENARDSTYAHLSTDATPGEIAVHFVNVGQGDCTLVVFPNNKTLLVDCGSVGAGLNAATVRTYLKSKLPASNQKIDLLVITHPDRDHYNWLEEVLGNVGTPHITVGKIMFSGSTSEYDERNTNAWLEAFDPAQRIVITGQEYNAYPAKPLPGFENLGVKVLAANV